MSFMPDLRVATARDGSQRHCFVAYQTTAEGRRAHGVPKDRSKGAVCGTIVHEGRGLNMTVDAHSLNWCTRRQFFTITPRKSQRSAMLRWLRY